MITSQLIDKLAIKIREYFTDLTKYLLVVSKLTTFLFVTIAIFKTSNEGYIPVAMIQGMAACKMLSIIFGPISHALNFNKRYSICIGINICSLLSVIVLLPLHSTYIGFLYLFILNNFGRQLLDTIFVLENRISTRCRYQIACDVLRIVACVYWDFTPLFFIIPLILDILFLLATLRGITVLEIRYVRDLKFLDVSWKSIQVSLTRVPSLITLVHFDKLYQSEIYAYCILLATQCAGFLATYFSVIWFGVVKKTRVVNQHYAWDIRILVMMSILTGCFIASIYVFYGPIFIQINGIEIDVLAVVCFTMLLFASSFSTLDVNHFVLYSKGINTLYLVAILHLVIFLWLFTVEISFWYYFALTYFCSALLYVIFPKTFIFSVGTHSDGSSSL